MALDQKGKELAAIGASIAEITARRAAAALGTAKVKPVAGLQKEASS